MSRIGKLPISIPEKVEVNLKDNYLTCKGPLGELSRQLETQMVIKIENNELVLYSDDIPHILQIKLI